MAQVGVIGLGAMGAPIARNLLKTGHTVTVYARRPEAMAPVVALGARGAASPAEVASSSDPITMVLDASAVEAVRLGRSGVIEGARPSSVVIDHSTIEPEAARHIASALKVKRLEMLDAPKPVISTSLTLTGSTPARSAIMRAACSSSRRRRQARYGSRLHRHRQSPIPNP